MQSKEILDVVLEHSETMIVEWADSKDGHGDPIIEDAIDIFAEKEEITGPELLLLKQNVRNFLSMDMAIMGW